MSKLLRGNLSTKVIQLFLLAILATTIDWVVINNGWVFWNYCLIGWALVWLICLLITGSFLLSLGSVLIISVVEDFLFLSYASIIGTREFYPLYYHSWIPQVFGKWATFMSYNWWGVPSAYYIGIGVGIAFCLTKILLLPQNQTLNKLSYL